MPNLSFKNFFADIDTVPETLQGSYYPSLNGFRGVAVLMVVFSHLQLTPNHYYDVFNGPLGVLFFFVLSGFLITTLCIKEKVLTKDLNLKKFYIRRVLRIFPVAWLYLVVIIILKLVFHLEVHYIAIAGAFLYLMDFSSFFRKYHSSFFTGHYWSLSVEEQFYLIMPFILKKSFKGYLIVLFAIIFLLPLLLCIQEAVPALNILILYAPTHFLIKFQSIAIGCFYAILMFKFPAHQNLLRGKLVLNIIAIVLIWYIYYNDNFNLENVFKGMASSVLIGYLIISNVIPGTDLIFRFLNLKALKFVGVLSYSIYIWQEIFTSHDPLLPFWMVAFPYNIIWVIVVSCASYYLYERYFLKLKSKFSILSKDKPLPGEV